MFKIHELDGKKIAELLDENIIIREAQDALDLIADLGSQGYSNMIIYEKNINKDFFNLKTRLAGDILQKFSNYHFRLSIIGNFSQYKSKSLRDFIHESNRGNLIFFAADLQSALLKLGK
jgi:hypothetical protein